MSQALLSLGAKIYGCLTGIRTVLYNVGVLRSYRSSLPVISIGNITAGGNGKTPLCLYVASECAARGMRPAILSRGYGGSERGPYRVDATDSPQRVGDEPLLMARTGVAPVYIARARAQGARQIEKDQSADIIILDDGFQHRALARQVDIVSVFAGTERAIEDFVAGKLLPEGLFRESRDAALRRASMIVISERKVMRDSDALAPIDERLLKVLPPGVPVYRSFFEVVGVTHMVTGKPIEPGVVQAFAAIANPETFFESLEHLGFSLVAKRSYADHYVFTEADIASMLQEHPDSVLICTSKDAVKLEGLPAAMKDRCGVLQVRARVSPGDAFMVQMQRRILSGKSR